MITTVGEYLDREEQTPDVIYIKNFIKDVIDDLTTLLMVCPKGVEVKQI